MATFLDKNFLFGLLRVFREHLSSHRVMCALLSRLDGGWDGNLIIFISELAYILRIYENAQSA